LGGFVERENCKNGQLYSSGEEKEMVKCREREREREGEVFGILCWVLAVGRIKIVG
jgi:hypothetical protein